MGLTFLCVSSIIRLSYNALYEFQAVSDKHTIYHVKLFKVANRNYKLVLEPDEANKYTKVVHINSEEVSRKEAKSMAFVNAYGVLATLENLCDMVDEAKAVCRGLKKPVSLCFDVTDGPCVTYHFTQDGCKMTEGDYGCTCKMKTIVKGKRNEKLENFSRPFSDFVSMGL